MLRKRVIPCLLLKDAGLVKTTRFKAPKYVGDPINAIKIFNDKEVDELMVLDITASREGRQPNHALIEKFASECFMPLCYGGGVHTVEQARQLFALGVEKICFQTGALEDLSLITRVAERFGNQSVVVSADIRKNWLGRRTLYSACGQRLPPNSWIDFLKNAVAAGAGEIVVNAVERDGTMHGMDLELIQQASGALSVPLIAMGGVGSLADIRAGIDAGASAVAAGSFFVFHGPHRAVLVTYPHYRELEQLLSTAS